MQANLRVSPRKLLGVLVAASALFGAPEASAAWPQGPLTVGQLPGADGCLSRTGSGGLCVRAAALNPGSLNRSGSVAVTPDGANVYVAAAERGAVVVTRRDPLDGSLRQSSCVAAQAGGGCSVGEGLEDATAVDVSPDGRHVYAVSSSSERVAVFSRDPGDGSLRQAPCSGPRPLGCAPGRALRMASDVTLSPDGDLVYVASRLSGSITVFRRASGTGALTEIGCVAAGGRAGCSRQDALAGANSVSPSADGQRVYATASESVAVLGRTSAGGLAWLACASVDGSGGACSRWPRLDGASSASVAPGGRHLYVAARISNAVTGFRVDAGSGRLDVVGCVSEDVSPGRCRRGYALDGATAVSVAPDGGSVYVAAGAFSHGLSQLRRDRRTGRLRQLGCVNRSRAGGACAKGDGLSGAATAALSPDGRNVYVLGSQSDALAVFGPDVGIVGRRWRVSAAGLTRIRLACPRNARGPCRGILRLRTLRIALGPRRRHAVVGSTRFSVPRGGRRWARVRVASRYLRHVRRAGRLSVRPTVSRTR